MTRSLFPLLLPIFVLLVIGFVRPPATMLRRRGAGRVDRAQPLADRGVVRRTTDRRYYFDSVRRRAQTRALLPLMIALLVALIAGTILLGRWLSRNSPVGEPAAAAAAARVQTLA